MEPTKLGDSAQVAACIHQHGNSSGLHGRQSLLWRVGGPYNFPYFIYEANELGLDYNQSVRISTCLNLSNLPKFLIFFILALT